jgi:hypothetical protein
MLASAGDERSGTDVISNRLRCTWMRKNAVNMSVTALQRFSDNATLHFWAIV